MGVIAETAVRVRADTKGFQSEAHAGIMGSILKVGAAAGAALGGLAIGKALFTDPIKQAGNFEQSLNVLQATSHATDARMKELSAAAMKLGNDTKLPAVSASDAANAMLELAKGGFSAKESMEGARGVLLLSTAAQIDGAHAATLVADSLHAFGLQAKDAGIVVNDFAGAANTSTATMDEVGQALQQSGQAFHTLGIPIGDATTAIAAMANAGIKGSDAGTSLKTMLQRLNPVTVQAKAAMKSMGVETFDSQGKFVGMRSVIEQMSPKLKAMSQEQRQAALNTIFGSDASRAAGIILGQTTAQWDRQHAAVTKAGQAQALADAQTKGFKGAMAALRSTIETVQLQIGMKLIPVLTTLAQWLTGQIPGAVAAVSSAFDAVGEAVGRVAEWLGVFQDKATSGNVRIEGLANSVDNARTRFDAIKDAIVAVVDVALAYYRAEITVVIAVVQTLVGVISDLVGWFQQNQDVAIALAAFVATLAAGYVAYQVALIATRAALAVAAAAQWLLNAAMTANPIALVVIAIAALVAALVLLYQRSATARAIMDTAWAGIKAGAQAAMNFITQTVIPAAIAAWERFGPGVVRAIGTAVTVIRTAFDAIRTVVTDTVDFIQEHWDGFWKVVGPIAKAQLDVARALIKGVLDTISGIVKVFDALVRGDWGDLWNALKGLASTGLDTAVTVIKATLRGLAASAYELAKVVADKIVQGIKTAPGKLAGLGGDLAKKIAAAAGEAAKAAFNMGKRIADSIISGIGNIAARVADKLTFGTFASPQPKNPNPASNPGGFKTGNAPGGNHGASGGATDLNLQASSIIAGISFGGALRAKIKAEMGNLFPPAIGAEMVTQLATIFNSTTTAVQAGVARMTTGMRGVSDKLSASLDGLDVKMDTKLKPMIAAIAAAPEKSREKLTTAARAVEKPMVEAFVKWVDAAKAAYDAKAARLMATVDATFAKAQAKLDKWKASSTPTEMLIAQLQAQAAQAQVDNAVTAAHAAIGKLEADFSASWAKLIADQARNMAALKASQAVTVTDRDIAGHEFEQTQAASANDPLATTLLAAQKSLTTIKAQYAEGTATQAQLFAAQDAFDAASIAAADSTNATKLLADYNTWQNLVTQTAAGAANITAQEAADAETRKQAEEGHTSARVTADQAEKDALLAQSNYALGLQATAERTARDAMFETMSNQLKARHDRIVLHLTNVQHAHDLAFDKLKREAEASGKIVGDNLAEGMNKAIPTVRSAASALAAVVRQYLKLASPSEKGPMSDLNTWWRALGPTLLDGFDASGVQAALGDAVSPPNGLSYPRYARLPDRGTSPREAESMRAWLRGQERMEALLAQIVKHTGTTAAKPTGTGVPEIHVSGAVGIDASVYRSKR